MSTPTDSSPTQKHIDEVVESLERSFTLLKRRTRDVLKLAYEHEELVAAIENREAKVAPAPVEPDHGTAIHGESAAPDRPEATPTVTEPGDRHAIESPTPPDILEPESTTVSTPDEPIVPADTSPAAHDAFVDAPEDPALHDVTPDTADPASTLEQVGAGEPSDVEPTHAQTDVADPVVQEIGDTTEPSLPSKWGHRAPAPDEASTSENTWADDTEADTTEATSAPALPETDAVMWDEAPDAAEPVAATTEDAAPTPAWETPDLEWSEDDAHVAPQEFPHPMPPIDAEVLEPPAAEFETAAVETTPDLDAAWEQPGGDAERTDVADAAHGFDDSPFAAEFEEHVEEVGGSLEPSPFDLDTPPQPASYRPRSLQGDRSSDAVAASSLLEQTGDPEPEDRSVEHVEAAWDDFAGEGTSESPSDAFDAHSDSEEPFEAPEPTPATSGSRLRDLVAQAQEAEKARSEQEKSDFDLINEDSTVSRYDKNSAKLPTVGISSEELSSSVASLRSSFTSDKKSGSSSRGDDSGPSRADKKAEKRAAKEAAKVAKAEAKRARKQRG